MAEIVGMVGADVKPCARSVRRFPGSSFCLSVFLSFLLVFLQVGAMQALESKARSRFLPVSIVEGKGSPL